jgi:hypothetical protein
MKQRKANHRKEKRSNERLYIPNKNRSRLVFGINSYTRSLSDSLMEKPKSLTRFLCCSLVIKSTSVLNSALPCPECMDNLFTAISSPSGR